MSNLKRVYAYIDGYNLYHAIKNLNRPHLKWVDLWKLVNCFVPPKTHKLSRVLYFSAIADWLPKPARRHQTYIDALETKGVQPILGEFKIRDVECRKCGHSWCRHEEKRTDVNLAAILMAGAIRNAYDEAFLISQDTDFVAVIDAIVNACQKPVKVVLPPHSIRTQSLIDAASSKAKISIAQLERCQLEETVFDSNKNVVAQRPGVWRRRKI